MKRYTTENGVESNITGEFFCVEDVKSEIMPLLKKFELFLTLSPGNLKIEPELVRNLVKAIKELEE